MSDEPISQQDREDAMKQLKRQALETIGHTARGVPIKIRPDKN